MIGEVLLSFLASAGGFFGALVGVVLTKKVVSNPKVKKIINGVKNGNRKDEDRRHA